MRIICLGHAMKETLPVRDARGCLEDAVRRAGHTVAASHCLSDGGDGFLEACEDALGGASRRERVPCTGPLGEPVEAELLLHPERGLAAVETARVCGLALVPPDRRDVVASTSAGVGDLLFRARRLGARRVLVGVGGTATSDAGAGMLSRLGEHLGCAVGSGADGIALGALRGKLGMGTIICSDVTNPLLGATGAAAVFGPQKGATPDQVAALDARAARFADTMERRAREECGDTRVFRDLPGAGAGGGLGFALMLLDGVMRSGALEILRLIGLDALLARSDGLVTCEGRFDMTSLHGKAPWEASLAAARAGLKALIACGSAEPDAVRAAAREGIGVVECCADLPPERRVAETPERIIRHLSDALSGCAASAGRSEP